MSFTILDSQLLAFNTLGFIPGPDENEEIFLNRIASHSKQTRDLQEALKKTPFSLEDKIPEQEMERVFVFTEQLYDIKPSWISAYYSDRGLRFFDGGMTHILQKEDQIFALFQVRKAFQKKKRFLKIYHQDEILAHEISHMSRMAFDEKKYEEFLAYRSSNSKLRQFLGPLLGSKWVLILLILSIAISILSDMIVFFFPYLFSFYFYLMMKTLPIIVLIGSLILHIKRNRYFKRCKMALHDFLSSSKKANAVIYRLTDKEIELISSLNHEKIRSFIRDKKNQSLRWKIIYRAYFQ